MPSHGSIYLRHGITTPLDPRVRDRIVSCLDEDPRRDGGLLADGRTGGRLVAEARERVSLLVGASTEEIVFTSGGTEAANLALKGTALAPRSGRNRRRILASATSATSVLHPARSLARLGFTLELIPVSGDGLVDVERLAPMLDEDVLLMSVEWVNQETGVIQPIREIAAAARTAGAILHVDAAVAPAHLPVSAADLGADLISFSAHRMYGPRGVGALYVRSGVRLAPLVEGGVEERGLRGGAVSVALVAGFGEAAALATIERSRWKERSWSAGRSILEGILAVADVTHNGAGAPRVEAMVNVSVAGAEGESLLLEMSRAGIAAASGSACFDEAGKPSHVLTAMGVSPHLAQSSMVLASGKDTTEQDVCSLLATFAPAVTRLRRLSFSGVA